MSITRYSPIPSKSLFQHFLANAMDGVPVVKGNYLPAVNILESPNGFKLELMAPGFEKEQLTIRIEKDVLTVSGQREQKTDVSQETFSRREFSVSRFERSFHLPESVDPEMVNAQLRNGILTIELAKKPEAQPLVKQIEVA